MAAGEQYKLNVESTTYEPAYDAAYLSKVDYDLWLGPGAEAAVQPQPLPLQLALALGLRQRRHRQPGAAPVRHRALGPRQERASRARQSRAAATSARQSSQETPDVHTSLFEYADGTVLEFATRGRTPTTRARRRSATCSTAPKGWVWIDGDGRKWQSYHGAQGREGPGRRTLPRRAAVAATRTC